MKPLHMQQGGTDQLQPAENGALPRQCSSETVLSVEELGCRHQCMQQSFEMEDMDQIFGADWKGDWLDELAALPFPGENAKPGRAS